MAELVSHFPEYFLGGFSVVEQVDQSFRPLQEIIFVRERRFRCKVDRLHFFIEYPGNAGEIGRLVDGLVKDRNCIFPVTEISYDMDGEIDQIMAAHDLLYCNRFQALRDLFYLPYSFSVFRRFIVTSIPNAPERQHTGFEMKVVNIKIWVVGNPPPHFGGRYFIFLKLTTDNGIEGVGEVYAATFSPHVIAKMIEDVADRFVIDHDPFAIEKLWRRVYGSGYNLRPDVSLMGVLSGLEMACWDIIGKAVDKPVYQLLGGKVHEKLRSYTYLYPREGDHTDIYQNPDLAAERAVEYVEQGFTAVKFDPAGPYTIYDGRQPGLADIERSVEFVRKIREAVGTRADLLFGTHGQFTAAGAIRLARQLEPYDPLWFEEPTPPENPAEMAPGSETDFHPDSHRRAAHHQIRVCPGVGKSGGINLTDGIGQGRWHPGSKKDRWHGGNLYAQIAPHLYCGPIEGAANIQLATCTPNFLILESIQTWGGFHGEILLKPVQWQDGYVIPSTEPGLGVELNEAIAQANPYTGKQLHLEMKEEF